MSHRTVPGSRTWQECSGRDRSAASVAAVTLAATRAATLATMLTAMLALTGCVSSRDLGRPPQLDEAQRLEAMAELRQPPTGDLAALYRLRVPHSGGLRCSVLARGDSGRLTISEHFGSALSLAAWSADGAAEILDLRQGCRLPSGDLSAMLGVGRLPMANAVRLLGGRLPMVEGDESWWQDEGWLVISGPGWAGSVRLSAQPPWRVVELRGLASSPETGWRLLLDEHIGSLPGLIRIEQGEERWAELKLIRLQWDTAADLPALPDLPQCEAEPSDLRPERR